MMLACVEKLIAERDWGVIISVRAVEQPGEKLQVKALTKILLGRPSVGETWYFEGEYLQSPEYGRQLVAQSGYRKTPTGKLICRYLADHVPGIGLERATRLWNKWNINLAAIISGEANIPEIATVLAPDRPNLAVRLAGAVVRAWKDAATESNLVDWLMQRGVEDLMIARRVARILGDSAIQSLASNPYILVPLLPSWTKLDEFARRVMQETGAKVPGADVRRLVGAVDAVVKGALADGHTALTQVRLRTSLARLLASSEGSSMVDAAITAAERNGAILRVSGGWRAPGAALLEENVAAKLRRMLEPSYPGPVFIPPPDQLSRLLDGMADPSCRLHEEQRSAVLKVMGNAISCLQGGAGVGKTYTLKIVCDLYENLDGRVLLGALAGKAALRLARSTGRNAFTLARIIGQLAERERIESALHNPGLDAATATKFSERLKSLIKIDDRTLVVLDEASMIDLPTLHAILRYMPEGARLLLTGDAAQLPPIGFGLVYHALVSDPKITANLAVIHRQSAESGIPAVSAAIRERRMPVFREYRGVAEGVSFVPCESGLMGDAVERTVLQLGGYSNGVLVVSPTKRGPAGVDALNARLHERLRPPGGAADDIKGFNAQYYTIGDPVMWLRNDYSRGLFNGLIGQVKAIPDGPRERWLEVLFDGESSPRTLQLEDLIDLTLAHAITCHKLQGSQAARVVVPIYESRLLDPSWVYTAITRAERQVILVGDLAVLRLALKRPWTSENRRVGFAWPLCIHGDEYPPARCSSGS
jgi:exodeoxyribonuclease V alpha subunit